MDDRYRIDLDWVWGKDNPDLGGVATLRVTVEHPVPGIAARATDAWLATIEQGEGDTRWRGGWRVAVRSRAATAVELELVSGGQDVADSLQDAVDALQDAVRDAAPTIAWMPQPIVRD